VLRGSRLVHRLRGLASSHGHRGTRLSEFKPERAAEFKPERGADWGSGGAVEALELSSDSNGGQPARLYRVAPAHIETRMWVVLAPGVGYLRALPRKQSVTEKAGYSVHESGELTLPSRERIGFDFPALVIGAPYRPNYFHWLFAVVGRYLVARRLVPADTRIVVNPALASFQREALGVAGVPTGLITELPSDVVASFPALYVPAIGGQSALSQVVVDALRTLAPDARPRRRLYVSRQTGRSRENGRRRRILNHDEVVTVLDAYGFETVASEDLSIREQIDLFAEAEAVLGVHGAGLTNAVFAPSGAHLIELQGTAGFSKDRSALFCDLATLARLNYLRVPCQPAVEHWKADVVVDCDRLSTGLQQHLGAARP
jgi:hypothetical protein